MTDFAQGPVFIGCSHGTDDLVGRDAVRGLLDAVRSARPSLDVREAFVDVQDPAVDEVVAGVAPGKPAVIVPLLLSAGYHVHVDIARAAASRPGTRAAATLGPDPRLADLLADSLSAAGAAPGDGLVLAAAGSSDDRALRDVDGAADLLQSRLRRGIGPEFGSDSAEVPGHAGRPVVAYAAGGKPDIRGAVADLRAAGAGRVAIASYLLAPGFFASRLEAAGADIATPPLLPAPGHAASAAATAVIARIALDRFDAAIMAASGDIG